MNAACASYHVGIWRHCLEREPDIPYPIDHGWVMEASGVLLEDWMSRPAAHEDVLYTVNSEIFARTLFSRNFAYAKFRENKTLAKWQNHSAVY